MEIKEIKNVLQKLSDGSPTTRDEVESVLAVFSQVQDHQKLKTDYAGLWESYEDLRIKHKKLKEEHEALKAGRSNLLIHFQALKQENEELKESKNNLDDRYAILQIAKDQLYKDYVERTHEKIKLQREVEKGKLGTEVNYALIRELRKENEHLRSADDCVQYCWEIKKLKKEIEELKTGIWEMYECKYEPDKLLILKEKYLKSADVCTSKE